MNKSPTAGSAKTEGRPFNAGAFAREYGVLVIIAALLIGLSLVSDSFLTVRNLLNIVNQSAPLMIIACALTLVIIGGGFDLSTGAIFGVAAVSSGWIATQVDPYVAILAGPLIGLALGAVNGLIITTFNVHSFLVTLATSLVYRGIAILITGGSLIPVRIEAFSWLGRGRIGMVNVAVIVVIVFMIMMVVLLNRTTFGRKVFAVGGNEEAAILSGIRTNLVKIITFTLSGGAAGLAGVITVSRLSMAEPQAGAGLELEAIAAVILGGTAITGGAGAIWRSIAGVLLMALIGNGFNILNVNPFFKDLTTGVIIVIAVALAASNSRR
ncbi:ABC transporter permease [Agrobacterium vitis]|uniref:Autoinducer 2 import system permease protein LsrD n=1 Tax=Agrobacterium vitis TaxID=373 RepID=A0A368NLW1_AGRVI|nr:ABC transporter permease [Agrobacterium vitis]KAA3506476.1 ABC transporter permease [Agrobacterium vitis]KAA3520945.1 ABC transporter permease [Agrobacterium vitis]MCF1479833.1 ABC transporter permease [Agrobacterium vitis]MUZ99267.1 ABC transporter permease [Agrobacterium vitis]MVA32669.1 ABC transporter permease [Agrobacterium vitis]